ncbi:MAG: hypothetical protein J0L92_19550 [Deltaproteobacteria bacterium]|nr:hypothetical protein [Deltaproteobacteria bacterium]
MSRVQLTDDGIKHVLLGEGYDVRRIAELTYRGQLLAGGRRMTFHLQVDPAGYVVCAIIPFLKSPADEATAHRLYLRMMSLNQILMMAKLSIDDDLDVVLSVEYPSAQLDESELADAMHILAYYADQHHDELVELAAGGDPEPRISLPPPLRTPAAGIPRDAVPTSSDA